MTLPVPLKNGSPRRIWLSIPGQTMKVCLLMCPPMSNWVYNSPMVGRLSPVMDFSLKLVGSILVVCPDSSTSFNDIKFTADPVSKKQFTDRLKILPFTMT